MSDRASTPPDDLARRVQRSAQADREQREPLALAYTTVWVVLLLCGALLNLEVANFHLALSQLFPALRDGSSGLDGVSTLALASVGGLLLGDALLLYLSEGWSENTRRRVVYLGLLALGVVVVSAMFLVPMSLWQASDAAQVSPAMANEGAIVPFSLLLAGLYPLSLFANFALGEQFKPAIGKIARNLPIDLRVGRKLRALARRDALQAQLRTVEQQLAHAQTDEQIAEECAAQIDAIIGEVRGHIRQVIAARELQTVSADAPAMASDVEWLNRVPVEQLKAHYDDLAKLTPKTIKARILSEETQS